jgi:hypothetical protein
MFLPRLMLQKENGQYGLQHIITEIKKRSCHEVVVIDPLYRAFAGSLNNDEVMREVVCNFDKLKDELNCALVIIHHTHKKKFDIRGKVITEGDDAAFGSVFIKAWASQIVMQTFDPTTGLRAFYCQTQRGGDIVKECNLALVQPDPLYFKEDTSVPENENWGLAIVDLLKEPQYKDGLTGREIWFILHISQYAFFKSVKQPLNQGYILKQDNKHPVRYIYNFEREEENGESKKV